MQIPLRPVCSGAQNLLRRMLLTGLEPVRCIHREILSLLRLPISPQQRLYYYSIIRKNCQDNYEIYMKYTSIHTRTCRLTGPHCLQIPRSHPGVIESKVINMQYTVFRCAKCRMRCHQTKCLSACGLSLSRGAALHLMPRQNYQLSPVQSSTVQLSSCRRSSVRRISLPSASSSFCSLRTLTVLSIRISVLE